MKRKHVIEGVTRENANAEQLALLEEQEAKGSRMTNMKEILLKSPVAFQSLGGSYTVGAELFKHIPRRAVLFFSYAVSRENKCFICGNYFKKMVVDSGVKDFDNFEFTDEEKDLLTFAEALTADPNHVPDEVYEKLQARYDDETLVLLIVHGLFTLLNNYFNNIVGTELDEYLYPYYEASEWEDPQNS